MSLSIPAIVLPLIFEGVDDLELLVKLLEIYFESSGALMRFGSNSRLINEDHFSSTAYGGCGNNNGR